MPDANILVRLFETETAKTIPHFLLSKYILDNLGAFFMPIREISLPLYHVCCIPTGGRKI
tara:strand:- start:1639 stop:1818 length:180 start_codon:yes stop_codon:yes gene_type:complete